MTQKTGFLNPFTGVSIYNLFPHLSSIKSPTLPGHPSAWSLLKNVTHIWEITKTNYLLWVQSEDSINFWRAVTYILWTQDSFLWGAPWEIVFCRVIRERLLWDTWLYPSTLTHIQLRWWLISSEASCWESNGCPGLARLTGSTPLAWVSYGRNFISEQQCRGEGRGLEQKPQPRPIASRHGSGGFPRGRFTPSPALHLLLLPTDLESLIAEPYLSRFGHCLL